MIQNTPHRDCRIITAVDEQVSFKKKGHGIGHWHAHEKSESDKTVVIWKHAKRN